MKRDDVYICIKSTQPYSFYIGQIIRITSSDIDPECGLEFVRYWNAKAGKTDYIFADTLRDCFILVPKIRPNDIWENLNR